MLYYFVQKGCIFGAVSKVPKGVILPIHLDTHSDTQDLCVTVSERLIEVRSMDRSQRDRDITLLLSRRE